MIIDQCLRLRGDDNISDYFSLLFQDEVEIIVSCLGGFVLCSSIEFIDR